MRSLYRLPLVAAQKQGKRDHIRLLNADLAMQRVRVAREAGADLINEWRALPWHDEWQEKEHDGFPNHVSDAALYAWRHARHYLAEPAAEKPVGRDSEKYMDDLMERRFARSEDEDY